MRTSVARRKSVITRAKASSQPAEVRHERPHFERNESSARAVLQKLTLIGGGTCGHGRCPRRGHIFCQRSQTGNCCEQNSAEKQIEIMKENNAKQVERAERRTMEKFLKVGCEEEFARYQKAVGVYKREDSDLTNSSEKSCME